MRKEDGMKKLIICVVAIVECLVCVAQEELAQHATEKNAKVSKSDAFYRAKGGFVFDKRKCIGNILIVNGQSKVEDDVIIKHAAAIENSIQFKVDYTKFASKVEISKIKDIIASMKSTVTIFIVDMPSMPGIISLPEEKCVLLNVDALASDSPSKEVLSSRVRKEMSRSVCFVFAVGYSAASGGVMDPMFRVKDLDRTLVDGLDVSLKMPIERSACRFYGMRPFRRSTYIEACQEGWAPPPKNEYQQAIWDKVHQIPDKPLKIEFDAQRGK